MNTLVHQLLAVPWPAAYAVIGALVFAEAAIFVGFMLPGETAVLLGGVLAGYPCLYSWSSWWSRPSSATPWVTRSAVTWVRGCWPPDRCGVITPG